MGRIRLLLLAVTLISLTVENCSSAAVSGTKKDVEVITEPRPGEEYVLVQTAKSKPNSPPPPPPPSPQDFSTSHQIPSLKEKQEKTKAAADENTKFTTSHRISRPTQAPVKQQSKLLKIVSGEVTNENKRDTRETSKGSKMAVKVEDEGKIGVIDEHEEADLEERKILARKAEPVVRKQSEKKETTHKPKPVHEEVDDDYETSDDNPSQSPEISGRALSGTSKNNAANSDKALEKKTSVVKGPEITNITEKDLGRRVVEEKFEIVSINKPDDKKVDNDEGIFDFVDTPLNDKILKSSGTSQASRVNIKKASNGQDYEYEYVYYYYDEDEDPAGGKASSKNTVNSHDGPARSEPILSTTTYSPRTHPTTNGQLSETTEVPTEATVNLRGRTTVDEPTRQRRPEIQDDDYLQSSASPTSSKQRYTTIERTRGSQLNNIEQVNAVPTTLEPASNEVLPTRGSRFRGRQIPSTSEETIAPVSEERLPANTRFPPRSRSNHNSNPSTTPTTLNDTPITRVRGTSGSVKRPSLELVDSSSFRTHASDVSPDQDQVQHLPADGGDSLDSAPRGQGRIRGRPAQAQAIHPQSIPQATDEGTLRVAVIPQQFVDSSKIPSGTTREQDLEEYVQPQRPSIRQKVPATESPVYISTLRGDIIHTTENYVSTPGVTTIKESGMTDKAAYDLYAILQQTQSEEANSLTGEPATSDVEADRPGTTDVDQTSFTQLPVTTVVVTQPPTTTTTTTTTTTPEPTTAAAPLPGRGRYRGGNGNTRNRIRPSGSASTTTTTEATEEGTTKRARFQPNKTRIEGQISAYGRRGSKKPVADQSESGTNVEEEVTPRSSGRGRYKSNRGSQNSAAATTTETPATTEGRARPSFGSADRFNSRRRPGGRGGATTAPHHDEDVANTSESDSGDASSATTTARPTRPRLNIAGGARPLRPGPKINIGGRGRIGVTSTQSPITTEQEPSTSPLPEEPPAEAHEQPAEATTAASDALTRLRNRPRLRVGEKQAKPQASAAAPPANRRQLVSGLLPKRPRPNQVAEATSETPAEEEKPVEEHPQEESDIAETAATVVSTTEQAATPESRLSSLIGNRRRIGGRRPGTLINRPAASEE